MERQRTIADDDRQRCPERLAPPGTPALGDVARDMMDQGTMILRDEIKLAKLEARRYSEHLVRDVAPRAAVAGLAAVAVLCGLIALFLGVASALGSVAWAFAVYGALFAVTALLAAGLWARRSPGALHRSRYPTGGSTSLATLDAPRKT